MAASGEDRATVSSRRTPSGKSSPWPITDTTNGRSCCSRGAATLKRDAPGAPVKLKPTATLTNIAERICARLPTATFNLDAASDTGTVGDLRTSLAVVNLIGQAPRRARVELLGTGLSTRANKQGQFTFRNVPLNLDRNEFTVRVRDRGGNVGQTTQIITLNGGPALGTPIADVNVNASSVLGPTCAVDPANPNSISCPAISNNGVSGLNSLRPYVSHLDASGTRVPSINPRTGLPYPTPLNTQVFNAYTGFRKLEYNSLQVSMRRPFRQGLQLTGAYTLSSTRSFERTYTIPEFADRNWRPPEVEIVEEPLDQAQPRLADTSVRRANS